MSEWDEQLERYFQRLGIVRQTHERDREVEILFYLGNMYSTEPGRNDIAKAIEYEKQAIIIFQQERMWHFYYRASEALGAIYEILLHDLRTALSVYERAIQEGGPVLPGSFEEKRRKDILNDILRVKADLRRAE